jgi:hypothetical protein
MKKVYFIFAMFFALVTVMSCEKNDNITPEELKIGDTYQGGIIFCINTAGKIYGWVCAPTDQSNGATWSEAKDLCDNLVLNGYDDWYLPTYIEIEQIGRANIINFSGKIYWTSSEIHVGIHAYYYPRSGLPDPSISDESVKHSVRAVRKFIN